MRLPQFVVLALAGIMVAVSVMLVATTSLAQERPPVKLTERGKQVHAETMLFDGHNDLPWQFREMGMPDFDKVDIAKHQKDMHTDIPRLKKGGVKAQFWSVYVPVSTRRKGTSLLTTLEQIQFVKDMVAKYPDEFMLCLSTDDIEKAQQQGKIASLIGMEGGHSIENSINVLRRLYKLGARYMTITHSETLAWADSATDDPKHGGLTAFGEEVILEMNRLGMLVDLSHVSDDCMKDALRVTKAPVIYSHSSARAIADHPRNVPDDVLKLVAKNRGVVMINFYSAYVDPDAAEMRKNRDKIREDLKAKGKTEDEIDQHLAAWDARNKMPPGSIHDVVDHIEHVIKVAGVEFVGIGSDYDGVGLLPTQLEDVSTYPLITQELLNRGYTAAQIKAINGGNVMRVFREAEKVAQTLANN